MCLITLAYKIHKKYPILFAANRDEFYVREAQQMHWWNDDVLAGKDMEAGGTWFGMNKNFQWAAITNYRNLKLHRKDARSRGVIIPEFLEGDEMGWGFLESLRQKSKDYNPFNLLLFDSEKLYYFNNIENNIQELKPGVYALSNAFLDSNWPKTKKIKSEFNQLVSSSDLEPSIVFNMLNDKSRADKDELPDTGVGFEWEHKLSAVFIKSPEYGTRCSTFLRMDQNAETEVWEKTFVPSMDIDLKHFSFQSGNGNFN